MIDSAARQLLGPLDPDTERALLSSVGEETEAFLEGNPDAIDRTLQMLTISLSREEDGKRFEGFVEDISHYIGPNLPFVLTWLVQGDSPERFHRLEESTSSSFARLCRVIIGSHGREILAAYQAWGEPPADWRLVWRNVYFDFSNEFWILKVRLERYDGESFTLESTPDSIAVLCRYLIDMLVAIRKREAFREETLGELTASMDALRDMLSEADAPTPD